ncbi:hypothetical protein DOTSEDRAFT_24446 [Dothistroma septosporum NZE10]|uniref:Uncharacterized protein n=1 Tax=Dothistroma septosporum (strain NZE10 / CBS 128990) TaxID=675120 RepID=N1PPP3_DOTSN|nr:hypothetical protein DOTSEDRAFT_24446 [Dothistroma septosporum NZE10]
MDIRITVMLRHLPSKWFVKESEAMLDAYTFGIYVRASRLGKAEATFNVVAVEGKEIWPVVPLRLHEPSRRRVGSHGVLAGVRHRDTAACLVYRRQIDLHEVLAPVRLCLPVRHREDKPASKEIKPSFGLGLELSLLVWRGGI